MDKKVIVAQIDRALNKWKETMNEYEKMEELSKHHQLPEEDWTPAYENLGQTNVIVKYVLLVGWHLPIAHT